MMTILLLMLGAAIPEIEGGALFLAGDQSEQAALHENAAKLFLQCAAESDALRPYALSRAAKNQCLAGRHADAEAVFHQVANEYPDGPWTRLTRMRMGDMRHQQGQVANARRYYADTLAGLEPLPWFLDKLAWNNADYALTLPGYEREGYAYFRSVVANTIYVAPRRDAARRLLKSSNGEDRLWGVYGLTRTVNLRDAREAMSKELIVIRGAQGIDLPLSSLDIALMAAQADPAGTEQRLETLLQANHECLWARVWLMLAAREQAANKQFAPAEMLARLLSSHFPDGRDAGDVWWYISERCDAADNKAGAQRAYRQLLDRHPDHVRAPRALFYLANAARESGKADAAYALYDALGRLFPEGRFTAEGYYRAAQLAESRKDTEKQTYYLRRAAGVGLGHFYAHRALYKLRRTFDGQPAPTRPLRVDGGDNFIDPMPAVLERFEPHHFLITNTAGYERINFFGIHGLEEGEWEALYCILTAPQSLEKHLFPVIADAGFMHTLHQYVFDRGWGMENGARAGARLRVEYPLAYWSKTRAIAKELDIDPYLVLAIARQESTFRAGVVSSAGATGVLQLMPATANWLAKVDARVSNDHVQRLKSPYNSIRLGAVYLERMLKRSQNNMVYALASYNAGPGNCDKWRARYKNYSLEAFMEAIPFSETNDYVKKVLGNFAAYHSIYPAPDNVDAAFEK